MGWAKENSGECRQCSSMGLEQVSAVAVGLGFVLWIGFTARNSVSASEAVRGSEGGLGASRRRGALFKILTTFAQCYGLARRLPIEWPLHLIDSAFEYSSFLVTGDGAVAHDCVLSLALPGAYQRFFAVAFIFPAASVPLVLGGWAAAYWMHVARGQPRRRTWAEYSAARIPVTFTIVGFILWPMICLRTVRACTAL